MHNWICRLLTSFTVLILPHLAYALDCTLVSIRFEDEQQKASIRQYNPGKLVLTTFSGGRIAATKILYGYAQEHQKVRNGVISPDGRHVAFVKTDGTLALIELERNETRNLTGPVVTHPWAVQWPAANQNDWIYYSSGDRNELRRVNVRSGQDEFIVRFDYGMSRPFSMDNSATNLLIPRGERMVLYDIRRGDGHLKAVPTWFIGSGVSLSPDSQRFAAFSRQLDQAAVLRMPDPVEVTKPTPFGYRLDISTCRHRRLGARRN